MKCVCGLFITSLIATGVFGQPTESFRVMTYNLLNYRNTTSYCDATNNSASAKDAYLAEIITYLAPDILICQEVGAQFGVPTDRILTNALNVNGVTKWAKAAFTNNGFSDLVNAAFYNTEKFGLHSQTHIAKDLNQNDLVRVVDFYRFYYKDSLLPQQPDTVFFTVVGVHLKAGATTTDKNDRTATTAAIMDYIQNNVPDDNVILCGDLNMGSGLDAAFQNIVNYPSVDDRLYDPVNAVGNWNANYSMRMYHTQSTRSSATAGSCFSGGGLDDRFDHILLSDEILNGSEKIEYESHSWTAVGNDGLHLDKDLKDGANNSAPANIINALHGMSDHLPVTIDLNVDRLTVGLVENRSQPKVRFNTTDKQWQLLWETAEPRNLTIFNLAGVLCRSLRAETGQATIDFSDFAPGVYLCRIESTAGETAYIKLMVPQ